MDACTHPQVVATIGHEKMGDGRLKERRYQGVWLTSRRCVATEFAVMKAALTYLRRHCPEILHYIEDIWCDSKVGSAFSLRVNTAEQQTAERIALWVSRALMVTERGHNDIGVDGDQVHAFVPADWEPWVYGL